ncbi:membrane-associated protein, putative [Bodo saltans]|uniref:Membrane-associated protein, putative n=1 Tax=Bodo saltans TaxID=75058 RepID=A0A0S4KK49_BODSA|nr:membrane-associated protein, putative [Bodo saltans]|eukprot:CUI14701.1 membrane-associated protein, putative [Bodo saltans]
MLSQFAQTVWLAASFVLLLTTHIIGKGAHASSIETKQSDADFCGTLPFCSTSSTTTFYSSSENNNNISGVAIVGNFTPPFFNPTTPAASSPRDNIGLSFVLRDCCIPNATDLYLLDDFAAIPLPYLSITNATIRFENIRARFLLNVTVTIESCYLLNVSETLVAAGIRGSTLVNTGVDTMFVFLRNTTARFYTLAQNDQPNLRLGLVVSVAMYQRGVVDFHVAISNGCVLLAQYYVIPSNAPLTSGNGFAAQWVEMFAYGGAGIVNYLSNISLMITDSTLAPTDPELLVIGQTDSTVVTELEVRVSVTRLSALGSETLRVDDFTMIVIRSQIYIVAAAAVNVLWFKTIEAHRMVFLMQHTNLTMRAIGNLPISSGARTAGVIDPAGNRIVMSDSNWTLSDSTIFVECYSGLQMSVVSQANGPREASQRTAEIALLRPVRMHSSVISIMNVSGWMQTAGGVALPEIGGLVSANSAKIVLIEGSSDALLDAVNITVTRSMWLCFESILTISAMTSLFVGTLLSYSVVGIGPENANRSTVSISYVTMTTSLQPLFPVDVYNAAQTSILSFSSTSFLPGPLTELSSTAVGCYLVRLVESVNTSGLTIAVKNVFMLGEERNKTASFSTPLTNHTLCTDVAGVGLGGGTILQLNVTVSNTSSGVASLSSSEMMRSSSSSLDGERQVVSLVSRRVATMVLVYFLSTTLKGPVTFTAVNCTMGRIAGPAAPAFFAPALTIAGSGAVLNISVVGAASVILLSSKNYLGVPNSMTVSSAVANVVVKTGGSCTISLGGNTSSLSQQQQQQEDGPAPTSNGGDGVTLYSSSSSSTLSAVVVDTSTMLSQSAGGGNVTAVVGCPSSTGGGVVLLKKISISAAAMARQSNMLATTVLDADVGGHATVVELLQRVRDVAQIFPLGKLSTLVQEGTCLAIFSCEMGLTRTETMPLVAVEVPPDATEEGSSSTTVRTLSSTIRAVNVIAASLSLSWTPTGALSAQRGWALRRVMLKCQEGSVVQVRADDTSIYITGRNSGDEDDGKLDVIAHPLQFAIPNGDEDVDADDHMYVRGAVVGNVVVIYTVSFGLMVTSAMVAAIRRETQTNGDINLCGSGATAGALWSFLRSACATQHVPGTWLSVVFPALMQAVVVESTVLLAIPAVVATTTSFASPTMANDVVLGVLGWLVVLFCVCHAAYVLTCRVPRSARAVTLSSSQKRPPLSQSLEQQQNVISSSARQQDQPQRVDDEGRGFLNALHKFVLSRRFVWIAAHSASTRSDDDGDNVDLSLPRQRRRRSSVKKPSSSLSAIHRLYGPLYDATRRGRHWWVLVEVMVSMSMGIASGLVGVDGADTVIAMGGSIAGLLSCKVIPWFLVSVAILFLFSAMIMTPYDRFLDQALLVLLASMTAVSSVVAAVPFGATDAGGDFMFSLDIASNLLSLGVVACDMIQWRLRWVSPWQTREQQQQQQQDQNSSKDPSSRRKKNSSMFLSLLPDDENRRVTEEGRGGASLLLHHPTTLSSTTKRESRRHHTRLSHGKGGSVVVPSEYTRPSQLVVADALRRIITLACDKRRRIVIPPQTS